MISIATLNKQRVTQFETTNQSRCGMVFQSGLQFPGFHTLARANRISRNLDIAARHGQPSARFHR